MFSFIYVRLTINLVPPKTKTSTIFLLYAPSRNTLILSYVLHLFVTFIYECYVAVSVIVREAIGYCCWDCQVGDHNDDDAMNFRPTCAKRPYLYIICREIGPFCTVGNV